MNWKLPASLIAYISTRQTLF
ncbi:hypothetical protein PLANTIT3_50251 [Plantibacter sp. T3]|nr:hypothetical protein PLANTIT3_50251 [Plantibacter sp. T3]